VTPQLDSQPGTAVITGAAHGIGAAFARRLAAGQKSLVLVDRDQATLESMPDSLAESGPAEVQTIQADLAQPEGQDRVIGRIERENDLSLLINNAGFGNPGLFHETDPQAHLDMLQVHIMSTVRFCRAALPGMVRSGRGNIINVSSMAAELPVYGNVMYGSTKGFLRSFSEILRIECDAMGVNVQLLCPGYTRTEFHRTSKYEDQDFGRVPDWAWSPADAVVEASLRALDKRTFICVPGFWNRCVFFTLRSRVVPKWVIRRLLV
jgi:short-subunit dehydrogenase